MKTVIDVIAEALRNCTRGERFGQWGYQTTDIGKAPGAILSALKDAGYIVIEDKENVI